MSSLSRSAWFVALGLARLLFVGALVIAHLRQAPPDPRTRVPSLSPAIAQALMRALAKAPKARFATAGEFVAALGEAE